MTATAAPERPPAQQQRWAIEVRGLSLLIRRPGQPAAVAFDLEPGEVVGLIDALATGLYAAGHAAGGASARLEAAGEAEGEAGGADGG